jgi:hypothetical protein
VLFRSRQAVGQLAYLLLQSVDVGVAWIGDDACLAELIAAPLELLFEVQVGAVERGAGDTTGGGEGLDVALAARRDLPAQQPSIVARIAASFCAR